MNPPTNARHAIERLLTTKTSSGKYSTGSEIEPCLLCPVPTVEVLLSSSGGGRHENNKKEKELSFPLDDNDVKIIKDNADRAGVGLGDKTVVWDKTGVGVRKT